MNDMPPTRRTGFMIVVIMVATTIVVWLVSAVVAMVVVYIKIKTKFRVVVI